MVSPASSVSPEALASDLKAEADRLGFDLVGIGQAIDPPHYDAFCRWLDADRHAGMGYMEARREARRHPGSVLEGVASLVMVGFIYGGGDEPASDMHQGLVARYARGADYHRLLWRRLEQLLDWMVQRCPEVRGRAIADTAPLLERDYAQLAGLGWIAKNTMLINKRAGSYTVLGALLLDVTLPADPPHRSGHCGTCTRCLEACPTDALIAPHQLDANRCISYWTIEHKGPIPESFSEQLHGWVFGCDICQEVCPWNRKATPRSSTELEPRAEWISPDLIAWLRMDPSTFRDLLRGTAQKRTKRVGLVRNAILVLGERRVAHALPDLIRLLEDDDPVIRGASAWALGRFDDPCAREALLRRIDDPDPEVRRRVVSAVGSGFDGPQTS